MTSEQQRRRRAAHAFADRGWFVQPLIPGTSRPMGCEVLVASEERYFVNALHVKWDDEVFKCDPELVAAEDAEDELAARVQAGQFVNPPKGRTDA